MCYFTIQEILKGKGRRDGTAAVLAWVTRRKNFLKEN
jgi:hypothetical protein